MCSGPVEARDVHLIGGEDGGEMQALVCMARRALHSAAPNVRRFFRLTRVAWGEASCMLGSAASQRSMVEAQVR